MPLLPASIGIVLSDDQTQLLLVKREDVPVWTLPGGGIETDETPEQALIREIEEETGYRIEILRKCAEYSPINALAAQTHVFVCRIRSGETCLSSETAAVAFHPLARLPAAFFHPHAIWLQEALAHQEVIRRPLTEISYWAFAKYFLFHPWQVVKFAWTRFMK